MTQASTPFDPRLTEQRNPASREIDLADPLTIVDLINAQDRTVPDAVAREREAIARAIEIATECLQRGGRILYVGAGTSGRLGVLDAAECPPTFGSDPERVQGIVAGGPAALVRSQEGAEDDAGAGAAAIDERAAGPDDFVLGIATSSTTPYVLAALRRARERAARTGFLCCTDPSDEVRALVDLCLVPKVGPEVIAGSTRMKAGTATKLVLNTLSTGVMIRLGKVYENLMVDLRASSEKLVDRGERIVMQVTGARREEARQAIGRAGGSVKTALVMQRLGVGKGEAERILLDVGGFVRRAFALGGALAAHLKDPYRAYPEAPPGERARAALLEGLERAPALLSEIAAAADDGRWAARPEPGKWSAKEHVAHLTVVNGMQTERATAILAREDPALADWDEDVENAKIGQGDARARPAAELLEAFDTSRARLLEVLRGRPFEDFTRAGRHAVLGRITLYRLLRHVVAHDDRHTEAVRRLLSDRASPGGSAGPAAG